MARILIGTSGWHYDSWRGPFYPAGLPIKAQLQYYASQFQSAELNGVFYRTPTLNAVESWKEQTGRDFVFTWKRRNSSRIGSDSRPIPRIVSNYWKTVCRYWATRPAQSFFNCHPISRPMQSVYPLFFECCRPDDATASNFVTPVGIRRELCACSRETTYRSAFPITMTRRRRGNALRISSMSEATVQGDGTRDITRRMPWQPGRSVLSRGKRKDATCLCTSIMTRRAPRPSMH